MQTLTKLTEIDSVPVYWSHLPSSLELDLDLEDFLPAPALPVFLPEAWLPPLPEADDFPRVAADPFLSAPCDLDLSSRPLEALPASTTALEVAPFLPAGDFDFEG